MGNHPLVVSLAATGEPLYIVNRSGSRPSHENAAGFRRVTLRGDTDFAQTAELDRWDDDEVRFVFGIDGMPNLYERVEALPGSAWTPLARPAKYAATSQPRAKPPRVTEHPRALIVDNGLDEGLHSWGSWAKLEPIPASLQLSPVGLRIGSCRIGVFAGFSLKSRTEDIP